MATDAALNLMTTGVLDFEVRPSSSPCVERVWRARSTLGGSFTSIAAANVEVVVERSKRRTTVTLRGPESAASTAVCPPETTWTGIRLRVGSYVGSLPSLSIRDGHDATFDVHGDSVVLGHGVAVPLPRFDDAEAFVQGLVAAGFLRRDALVESVVSSGRVLDHGASHRTVQRRFARVTGLTRRAFLQIERARFATHLLQRGADIADVVLLAGFVDQAHVGRAFCRYVGMTPAAARRGERQLSLLYKTDASPWAQTAP